MFVKNLCSTKMTNLNRNLWIVCVWENRSIKSIENNEWKPIQSENCSKAKIVNDNIENRILHTTFDWSMVLLNQKYYYFHDWSVLACAYLVAHILICDEKTVKRNKILRSLIRLALIKCSRELCNVYMHFEKKETEQ